MPGVRASLIKPYLKLVADESLEPADVAIEAPIVDIYYSHHVGRWLSRPVALES